MADVNVRSNVDALAPGLAVPVAGRFSVICPDRGVQRLGFRVARTLHVGEVEADARPDAVLFEPGEVRPTVDAAPALDPDLVGQVGDGMLGGVLHRGVDLEGDDAPRLKLGGDFADLGPERRPGRRRQRARGVDDNGDRVDTLRSDRGQVEARVDETSVGQVTAPSAIGREMLKAVLASAGESSRRFSL